MEHHNVNMKDYRIGHSACPNYNLVIFCTASIIREFQSARRCFLFEEPVHDLALTSQVSTIRHPQPRLVHLDPWNAADLFQLQGNDLFIESDYFCKRRATNYITP